MRPELGASKPVSILMVVDFPAPLGPESRRTAGRDAKVHILHGGEVAEAAREMFGSDGRRGRNWN